MKIANINFEYTYGHNMNICLHIKIRIYAYSYPQTHAQMKKNQYNIQFCKHWRDVLHPSISNIQEGFKSSCQNI